MMDLMRRLEDLREKTTLELPEGFTVDMEIHFHSTLKREDAEKALLAVGITKFTETVRESGICWLTAKAKWVEVSAFYRRGLGVPENGPAEETHRAEGGN